MLSTQREHPRGSMHLEKLLTKKKTADSYLRLLSVISTYFFLVGLTRGLRLTERCLKDIVAWHCRGKFQGRPPKSPNPTLFGNLSSGSNGSSPESIFSRRKSPTSTNSQPFIVTVNHLFFFFLIKTQYIRKRWESALPVRFMSKDRRERMCWRLKLRSRKCVPLWFFLPSVRTFWETILPDWWVLKFPAILCFRQSVLSPDPTRPTKEPNCKHQADQITKWLVTELLGITREISLLAHVSLSGKPTP